MRKKKIIAVVAAATLALSMVGCDQADQADQAEAAQAELQIRISHFAGSTVSHPTAQQENLIRKH